MRSSFVAAVLATTATWACTAQLSEEESGEARQEQAERRLMVSVFVREGT